MLKVFQNHLKSPYAKLNYRVKLEQAGSNTCQLSARSTTSMFAGISESNKAELSARYFVSGLAVAHKKVVTSYRMAEISLPEVIRLRQNLFDERLIHFQKVVANLNTVRG